MRVIICYFSGTGNTKKVVTYYSETLTNMGHEVALKNMEEPFDLDLEGYDLIGFAYPIHAFNAPKIVLDFAKKIKKQKTKTKYFILKSSGEPLSLNNISSYKLRSILRRRNFYLTNEYHYVMPYNMIFRHTDEMAYRMWETAKQVIPIDCKQILDGEVSKLKYIPLGHFLAWVFRIEHWGGRFNGRKYKVNDECIKCQLCVLKCPAKNISIKNGEFHFGNKCLMCMRCSFFCPKNAIKIGWFNNWKVNGAYNFEKPVEKEVNKHEKYCKKAYKKYFEKCEAKVKANMPNDLTEDKK